jgi:phospholipid/cholesterol/gamma-HCH transport system substrate-binding protein
VAQLRAQLPGLQRSLAGLAPLAPVADTALRSAGKALDLARPIARVARFYGSDLILGVFAGLAGVATANHDQWGHYARLEFTQPYQTSLGGPLSGLLAKPLLPGLFDLRTRLSRRCPGGNTPPAPDGSSPWVPDPSICDPAQDVPAAVNTP